jgi:hypothetical protein
VPFWIFRWSGVDRIQRVPVAGSPVAGIPVAGSPVAGSPVAGIPVAGIPAAGAPEVDLLNDILSYLENFR